MNKENKEEFMRLALKQAQIALELNEVPIGAIIVQNETVLATGYNLRELSQDATTHAEMQAIRSANQKLKSWRLLDTKIFITVEPCLMCSGAILLARIAEVYFGAYNHKGGSAGTNLNVFHQAAFNHEAIVEGGILEDECASLMSKFFKNKRKTIRSQKDCDVFDS